MAGFLALGLVYIALDDPNPVRLGSAAVALLVVFLLQVGVISNPEREPGSWSGVAALVGQAGVAALTPWFGYGFLLIMGFVAGSSLLVLPRRARWVVFGLVCVVDVAATSVFIPVDAAALLYITVSTAGTGLTVYGLTRLRQIAAELDDARAATGDLATAQERLRLSQQLHGTIGYQLSSIALDVQLAIRLLVREPARAVPMAMGIVATARTALADVRATARRYRAPELDDAIAAARVTLDAAGVQVDVRAVGPSVPVEVGAVLGTMLRVAVDDVVGAERVRRCELTVSCADGRAVLEISDDRPDPHAAPLPCDLREAVEAVSATVTRFIDSVPPPGIRWHHFRGEVPLPAGSMTDTGDPDRMPTTRPSRLPRLPFAQTMLTAVLVGYAINGVLFVLLSEPTPNPTSAALGTGTVAAVMVLQLAVISRRGSRAVHRLAALAAQAALSVGSIALLADPYVGLPGFVAGSALLVLPRGVRWPAFAAVALAVTAAQAVLVGAPDGIAYGLFATVNHGLVVYGLTRLRDLVDVLGAARADVAALAVTRERLRFAGDLHDLLGYGLSAIALKGELAARLVVVDPVRARGELDDVLGVTGRALADIRSVAGAGEQGLDLVVELRSVRSVLDAAGVALRVSPGRWSDLAGAPAAVGTVLATVLREAVTNVLRHSDARTCSVTVVGGRVLRLEVVNDGVRAGSVGARSDGSGLVSLAARAADLGGSLTAERFGEDEFRVEVSVPVDASVGAGGLVSARAR
ncbi:MAG: histidine kinase [Pseudonocardia sp.]|nr:histidine kinase [Pseudonocardia sp.]